MKNRNRQRAVQRAPRKDRVWRPFEQTIAPTVTTTAAQSASSFSFSVATLASDLSGAAINRRLILRSLRVRLAPFALIGTTTTPAPQLSGQLYFNSIAIGVSVPMTQIRPFNATQSTVYEFRVPRDLAQAVTSSSSAVQVSFVTYNAAGASALAYTLYPTITSRWDMAEDSFA